MVDFAIAGMDALSTDLQSLLTVESVGTLAANSDLEPYVQTVFDEGRNKSQLAAVPVGFIWTHPWTRQLE